ncbi:hypothetical protein HHI36_021363 [Cryptolaemus montrouzieri]|uniref:Uncharacterized protein n=1 Tax=Cryptolaemus montrouzieri TaxID=559131 RepID=A0ABD2MXC5_9CUCU
MNENVLKTISDRNEFVQHLQNDLSKNEENQTEKKVQIEKLTETIKNLKFLGSQPEWDSIIPLGKRIYIPGKIIHTGEYLLEKKSYPYSFNVLATIEQTVDCLEEKKEVCEEHLEKYGDIERQLKERMELLGGIDGKSDNVCDLPEKIMSDKGVAVRVGEFYEILEFEDN